MELDAIIATGGREANRYFEAKFGKIKHLCRSSRHSVAIIDEDTSPEQMEQLALDIYSYSGLGCRNVSMIFTPRGMKVEIPSYKTSSKYRNSYLQSRALAAINGTPLLDNGCSVIFRSNHPPTSLGTLSVFEYDSLEQVEQWISLHEDELQCIVAKEFNHPRRVDFGQAQHPSLTDYADGVDTMKFLEFND